MSEQPRICKRLLLLVGSNPLPNYLVALILNPESICLFYSPETEKVKDYLYKTLIERFENVSDRCIGDATDPSKVREAFASIPTDAHLNYTGGTKIMAAHARLAFRDAGGTDDRASYLDERNSVLRFDDGYEIDISQQNLDLTIDEIRGLHGYKFISKREISMLQGVEQDLKRVAEAVLNAPEIIGKLTNVSIDKYEELMPGLNSQILFKNKGRFQKGAWLEDWVGGLVKQISGDSEIYISYESSRSDGRKFEIDVVLIRGHRMYAISCTTQSKLKPCKLKLFEIAMRARQLGGDLARSALICLLYGSDNNGAYVDQLRNDVAGIWDASNTPEVFCLDDLKEWAGIHSPADVGSLKNWLES